MKMTSRGLLLLMGLVASTGLVRESGAQGITFQTQSITLFTASGRQDFTVYVAENASQTNLGLRYLHEISPQRGPSDLAIACSSNPDQCSHGWSSAACRSSIHRNERQWS